MHKKKNLIEIEKIQKKNSGKNFTTYEDIFFFL